MGKPDRNLFPSHKAHYTSPHVVSVASQSSTDSVDPGIDTDECVCVEGAHHDHGIGRRAHTPDVADDGENDDDDAAAADDDLYPSTRTGETRSEDD